MPPLSAPPPPATLWRSLEEAGSCALAAAGEPRASLDAAPGETAAVDRRDFLKTLGASFALAGIGACSRPPQGEIVPYVDAPTGQTDGVPRFFATSLTREGFAHGVLVESHMGRPTKIEGNPRHPASLGGTDIFDQAAVLELWDPDRSQAVLHRGEPASWSEFEASLSALTKRFARSGGLGLHLLTRATTSPTLAGQIAALRQRYPQARLHVHQPAGREQAMQGAQLAFGSPLATRLYLDRARIILSLDADFLADAAAGVRYAHDFAAMRSPEGGARMSRLYAIEATPSLTGAMADHRLPLESVRIQRFARQLAKRLGLAVEAPGGLDPGAARWLEPLARDLEAHRGEALVIVGAAQPPWLHALGHLINDTLRAGGVTCACIEPPESRAIAQGSGAENSVTEGSVTEGSLAALTTAMHAGAVDTLIMLEANPVYDAPADLRFAAALARVPHLLHLGLYCDETGAVSEWHLPQAHALETWSDARAFDGTVSIAQPLIAPLYGGRSPHELLAMLLGDELREGRALVRRQWQATLPADEAWNEALRAGLIDGSALPDTWPRPREAFLAQLPPLPADGPGEGLELLLRPDPTIGDGRWANNGWLQELPKPLTQLTWDNPVLISPALAAEQRLVNGDLIELRLRGRSLRAAVWIMPGQAPRSVTLHLGYGRRRAGRVGDARGFDAYALQCADAPWGTGGLEIVRSGARYALAGTQQHFSMQTRAPVRVGTLANFRREPHFATTAAESSGPPPSLYPQYPRGEYAWAMSIDLNACIGCKACTIACQAENNIPVVGKEEVLRGREMHWIRVDRYYEGAAENPRSYSQPVPCMMCEHAPCELVCPVDATVHDAEGLNLQVYNRCVGTRFCSNNCPYKVRRFNFLQYIDPRIETLKAQRNPEVSVRRRGVMEKCTYCIQRIEGAHIAADREGRRIRDGEILTACQAACPTQAIRFGDGADAQSAVAQAKQSPRNYVLLRELNTRPRTSYLARVRNPNEALEDPE